MRPHVYPVILMVLLVCSALGCARFLPFGDFWGAATALVCVIGLNMIVGILMVLDAYTSAGQRRKRS